MIIKAFIVRHPVLNYYALVFAISWGGILIAVGPAGFLGTTYDARVLTQFVYLAALAGPTVAGIVMTYIVDGPAGLRGILSRLGKWRVNLRWYVVALLLAPLLTAAILYMLSLTSDAFLPTIVTTNDKSGIVLTGVALGLVVCFFEELGWTGFGAPMFRRHHGIFATGIFMGLLWGLWHLPLFSASASSSGTIAWALNVAVLLFSFLPPYRVLMIWVYDRTNSLLVVMLMHASLTAGQLILIPPAISGPSIMTFDLTLAAALWIIVAVIAFANGGRLSLAEIRADAGAGSVAALPRVRR
jgi:membrane protease YdiL (CAAX protease family)